MPSSTITLTQLDSLMEKCRQMALTCFLAARERVAEPEFTGDFTQDYNNSRDFWSQLDDWFRQRENDRSLMSAAEYAYFYGYTGDAALDDDEDYEEEEETDQQNIDYCSEMDECFIAVEEPLTVFEEITDVSDDEDDDSILSVIDFSEEINLNDLYYSPYFGSTSLIPLTPNNN